MLASAKDDKAKINEFWELKNMIRINMFRGLTTFRFICLLLEDVKKLAGSEVNPTQSNLFQEIFMHFNEEIKCLNFK